MIRYPANRAHIAHGDLGIGQEFDQLLPHFLGGMPGQDPAIDNRLRRLRKGVIGMAGGQAGRDTGGVQRRIINRVLRKPSDSRQVRRVLENQLHVFSPLSGFDLRRSPVIGAGDIVQLERKLIALQAPETIGEVVNGIVRDRDRAVAPRACDRELEVGVDLFGGVHFHDKGLAMLGHHPAPVVIEHELGVNQVAMILDQPIDAVRAAALPRPR